MSPIVLVHGIIDNSKVFGKMSSYLKGKGYDVHCVDLIPNYGIEDLRVLATQVKTYIDNNFSGEQKIHLVGFSMGGLVTRYYLQRLEGLSKINKYVSISAPNNGTNMARTLPLKGIRQMRPDSDFLRDLNGDVDEQFSSLDCLFLWTPYDLMIIPAHSSILPVGKSFYIPVLTHKWMISDSRVLDKVNSFLKMG